jgi:uncharacterized protein (TIGR02145 family)
MFQPMFMKYIITSMKNKFLLYPFLIFIYIFSGCAKIFYSPDAFVLARNQRVIAVIPPVISITTRKKEDLATLKEIQKAESIKFQKEMYSWLLKRKMQGKIIQEIQEIDITNTRLIKVGYPENPMTSKEICEILGVDGVITSDYGLSKPMSEGAAIAVGLLLGAWGSTNEIHVTVSISDCIGSKLIWNFDHKYSGSVGSSPGRLVDILMQQASKNMPYLSNVEARLKNNSIITTNKIIPASDISEYTKETKSRISETDTIEQEKKTIITNSVINAEFVKDIDGNKYKIVKIGNKLWMSDNLKVTRFNNGVELLNTKNKSKWSNINKPAWCMYDNSEIYHNITGKIYNGYVVRNYMQICPTGWHIPDEQDWNELISFFGSSEQASINLRSKKGWKQLNGSNSSGMMILPGGVRNLEGNFLGAGNLNVFWSSSPDQTGEKIQIRTMDSQKHGLNKKTSSFNNGYYIRCVRN